MSWLDRSLAQVQRLLTAAPASRPPDNAPAPEYPERARTGSAVRTIVAVATAIALPVAFGLLLVPFRDHLDQSISLLMVLPVLVVALLGGARLATVAALAAAGAFDVFHTEPYFRPTIDDADDIVETIVLLVIGVTIGIVAQSAQRAVVAARIRRNELAAVSGFLDHIGTDASDAELAQRAGAGIVELLDAVDFEWRQDYRGTASPVLWPDGGLTSELGSEPVDAGVLPRTIEIPVGEPPTERGRFIVRTNGHSSISLEERRAASTIANALARCMSTPGE